MTDEVKKETTETEKKPETKEASVFSVDSLVGLAKEAAKTLAEAAGYKTRIVEEDGVSSMITMEVNTKRVNFSVAKGSVEKVKLG